MERILHKILVPIDFSVNSKNALLYSSSLAQPFQAELHLLYVIEPVIYSPDFSMGQITLPSIDTQEIEARSREELQKLIKTQLPETLPSRITVRIGKPFSEIIDYARQENIDLIVISSHGHSSVEHILFGSTSEKVVKKAPCPVLTLREPLKGFNYKEQLTAS